MADQDRQCDILMTIDGYNPRTIEGESNDDDYYNSIELLTFAFGGPSQGREKSTGKKTSHRTLETEAKERQMGLDGGGDDDDDEEKRRPVRTTMEFDITKDMDLSSPSLLQAFCRNLTAESEPFSKVVVYTRLAGSPAPILLLEMTFRNVFIVQYSMDVKGSSSIPSEKIKFVFDEIELKYCQQKVTGDASPPGIFGFNFKEKKQKKMM